MEIVNEKANGQKKNILFLLRFWPVFGGGESVTIALSNEFVNRGYKVFVAYLWDKSRGELPFIDPRITSIKITRNGADLRIDDQFLSERMSQIIADYKIDFVINQWWLADIAYKGIVGSNAILIKCHHISVQGQWIVQIKNFRSFVKKILGPVYCRISKKLQIRAIDEFYRYSDYVMFLSPSYVDQYRKLTSISVNEDRIGAIFNPKVYSQYLAKEHLYKKENIALFVGRIFEPQKRLTLLLKFWLQFTKKNPNSNWRLVIVGEGPDLKRTITFAQKVGLKSVEFAGFQQPDEYYKKAKIFLMTSFTEGLPMTLIEAKQNLLVPIVMDMFPSLHDILTDDVDGCIVPNNLDLFEKAFESLIVDEKRMIRLALNHDKIERFSLNHVGDEWEKLFKRAKKYLR